MTTTPQWKRLAFLSLLLLAVMLAHPVAVAAQGPTRWEHAGGPPGGAIYTLVSDPQRAEVLFAGTSSGIYKSRTRARTGRQLPPIHSPAGASAS